VETANGAHGESAFPGKGRLHPEQEELHRLRQENQRLWMERERLQKATLFCANEVR
jgi:transposase